MNETPPPESLDGNHHVRDTVERLLNRTGPFPVRDPGAPAADGVTADAIIEHATRLMSLDSGPQLADGRPTG